MITSRSLSVALKNSSVQTFGWFGSSSCWFVDSFAVSWKHIKTLKEVKITMSTTIIFRMFFTSSSSVVFCWFIKWNENVLISPIHRGLKLEFLFLWPLNLSVRVKFYQITLGLHSTAGRTGPVYSTPSLHKYPLYMNKQSTHKHTYVVKWGDKCFFLLFAVFECEPHKIMRSTQTNTMCSLFFFFFGWNKLSKVTNHLLSFRSVLIVWESFFFFSSNYFVRVCVCGARKKKKPKLYKNRLELFLCVSICF